MIEIRKVSKSFEDIRALKDVTANIEEGHVFGLIGTNGSGKSTLMRTICGIYKCDDGEVLIDGMPVYDNPEAKGNVFYISDDQFFFAGGTPLDMLKFYETMYPGYDSERFKELLNVLDLDINRKIDTFSKGMKKQLSVVIGVCSGCKYLLCDETFDGLDPVMRQSVKKLFIKEMDERGLTPIIASHNLRELEDICDHVGLLHKGGILFDRDLDDLKLEIYKIQCVFNSDEADKRFRELLEVIKEEHRGSLRTYTVKGTKEAISAAQKELMPIFFEMLPLTLEEIFISETEGLGYDFTDLTK